ncbi:MAG: glycosyltransferase [Clostridia bacterium]|nr:glycosyltransferase [Clostridia bacterium]
MDRKPIEFMNHNIEPLVSVICVAFNHEKYIAKALDGFVAQRTSFPFEVLVHDDASTDGTAAIIRDYEDKYPNIIKAVYQTENQYSKGVKISATFLLPKCKGKYIAFCEGDDCWIDPDKLQMQVEILESHPEYSACVHNSIFHEVQANTEKVQYPYQDRILGLEDVIYGNAVAFQTSSLIHRKEYAIDTPEFCFAIKDVGDYPKSIYLTLNSKIYYLGKVMSVHNVGVEGSWTARVSRSPKAALNNFYHSIEMLKMADEYSKGQHKALFQKAILHKEAGIAMANGEYALLKKDKFREYYKGLPFRSRIKISLKALFPSLVSANKEA